MSILKIKDINGNWQDIPAIKGQDGKDGEVTLEQLEKITGNLDDLSTEDKSNLVNAINEVFSKSSELQVISEGTLNLVNAKDGLYKVLANVMIKEYSSHKPYKLGTDAIFLINGKHSYKFNNYTVTYNDSSRGWTRTINFDTLSRATSYDSNWNITGKYIFTTLPETSVVPTNDRQLVNKKYVDDNSGSKDCPKIYYWENSSRGTGSTISLRDEDRALFRSILDDIQNNQKIIILTNSTNSSASQDAGSLVLTPPSNFYGTDLSTYSGDIYFKTEKHISYGINTLNRYEVVEYERYYVLRVTFVDGILTRTYIADAKKSALKQDTGILSRQNTVEYTPTSNYNPATKKYVDDAIATSITSVLEGEY